MTPKQQRFVDEYLVDLNATAAAKRAGYSERTAHSQGERLLRHVEVGAAVQAALAARASRTKITADRVLQELACVAFADPRRLYQANGALKAVADLDDESAAVLASVEVFEEYVGRGAGRTLTGHTRKIKLWDKVAALRNLAQHLGLLKEVHEHTGPGGGPIPISFVEVAPEASNGGGGAG